MTAFPNGREALATQPPDFNFSREMDRVETAITAVNKTLTPSLWASARKTPAVAKIVIESMRALADLHRERDALEEQRGA